MLINLNTQEFYEVDNIIICLINVETEMQRGQEACLKLPVIGEAGV